MSLARLQIAVVRKGIVGGFVGRSSRFAEKINPERRFSVEKSDKKVSQNDAERRDRALKRMLNTPPTPHKDTPTKSKESSKKGKP